MKKLAILASGRGSNLTALIEANQRGDLNLPVSLVICNNGKAKALQIAQEFGIREVHISRANTEDVDGAILSSLLEHDISVVALAGYMRPESSGRVPGKDRQYPPGAVAPTWRPGNVRGTCPS